MIVVAGLGNPGKRYLNTRHNLGFKVIDSIKYHCTFPEYKEKFNGYYTKKKVSNIDVVLIKPMTFMNCSGDSIEKLINFYKLKSEELIVIYDDFDMEIAKIRIKKTGSHGGHNGIKNIISKIGMNFIKFKIGIKSDSNTKDPKIFVLEKFTKEEMLLIESITKKISDNFEFLISKNFQTFLNNFKNGF